MKPSAREAWNLGATTAVAGISATPSHGAPGHRPN